MLFLDDLIQRKAALASMPTCKSLHFLERNQFGMDFLVNVNIN